jgi:hypothetical protein
VSEIRESILVGDADHGVRIETDVVNGEVRLTLSKTSLALKARMTPDQARRLAVSLGQVAGEADRYATSVLDEVTTQAMTKAPST